MMVCYRVPANQPVKTARAAGKCQGDDENASVGRDFSAYSQTVPNQEATIASLASSAGEWSPKRGPVVLLGLKTAGLSSAPGDSNSSLAKRRAVAVRNLLLPGNLLDPGSILADSLYQHEQCKGSGDVRAVFPVLIHVSQ